MSSFLDNLYIHCIQTFTAILHFECYIVVFTDLVDNTANVYENIFATIIWLDETETIGFIKELYCTYLHCNRIENN